MNWTIRQIGDEGGYCLCFAGVIAPLAKITTIIIKDNDMLTLQGEGFELDVDALLMVYEDSVEILLSPCCRITLDSANIINASLQEGSADAHK